MHIPFVHSIPSDPDEQHPVVAHEPESLSMEGGEFLDDGLRMEDLAYVRTEEIVAAGSPRQLL